MSSPVPPAGLDPAPALGVYTWGYADFEDAVFLFNFDAGPISGGDFRADHDRYGFNGRLFAMLALNPSITSLTDFGPYKLVMNLDVIADDDLFGDAMVPPYYGYNDVSGPYLYILGGVILRTVGGPWATPGGAVMNVLFPDDLGWIPIVDVS